MTLQSLPLEGVRILDLTMVWAGPSGTRLLADMGAECIKVESARSWDMLRSLHFLGGETERWWNKAAYFNHNNRNKYACTLDLQTERGRELALRLAAMWRGTAMRRAFGTRVIRKAMSDPRKTRTFFSRSIFIASARRLPRTLTSSARSFRALPRLR